MRTPPNTLPVFLEVLEQRIAPAGLVDTPFKGTPAGTSILLAAGEGLSTSDDGGAYLLYVEKGSAMVFTTDLNANNAIDFNEITGIAAGDGLRLISYTDINGDIVTNLGKDGRLTDADGDASNGYDGRVVLNSRIESIVLRSLIPAEFGLNNPATALAKSTYSINGNIYAGGGFGLSSGGSGLLIDSSGFATQAAKFGQTQTIDGSGAPLPSVGFIFTGSATSGQYFSFGTSPVYGDGPAQSLRDTLVEFIPAAGQAGADVVGVRAVGGGGAAAPFMLGGIVTGNGGFGARGGDISDVSITGDIGGLLLSTGHGGDGESGGNGGSILRLSVSDSTNSEVRIATGNGGAGLTGKAGQAGNVVLDGELQLFGRVTVGLGKGGDAFGNAGTGTSISSGTFVNIDPGTFLPAGIVTTWRTAGDIGDQRLLVPGDPTSGYVTNQFDIDGDGFNDAVVLTDNPDQLFVAFGNADPALPGTFDPARTYFLPSPSYAEASVRTSAVVVLDANGDGRPDIVTGQSTGDGFSGVVTYLNSGADPVTSAWLGFAMPRYSPLPVDPDAFARPGAFGDPADTPQAIINLVAGDFNRDGFMDLGVMSMGRTSNVDPPYFAYLGVMSGLVGANGDPDGFFALDFGKGTGNVATLIPFVNLGRSDNPDFSFVVKATASEAGNPLTDLIAVISKGGETGASVTAAVDRGRSLATFIIDPAGTLLRGLADLSYSERTVGEVVGNRQGWTGYGNDFDIHAADFIVADVDRNGAFDAIVVGEPTGNDAPSYLVAATLQGDLLGGIVQDRQVDNVNFLPATPGYFGVALTEQRGDLTPIVASVLDRDFENVPILRMVAGDFDGDPRTTNFVLNGINLLIESDPPTSQVAYFAVAGFGQYNGEFVDIAPPPRSTAYTPVGNEGSAFHTSFFGYYAAATGLTAGLENYVSPNVFWVVATAGIDPAFTSDRVFWFPIAASTLSLSAGSGGWSLLGAGGAGGSVGGGAFGGSAILSTGYLRYNFEGAAGGFGLLAGGRAGNVSGVEATAYHNFEPGQITFLTRQGGSSLLGGGGAGGTISQFRTDLPPQGGTLFSASWARGPFVDLEAGQGGFGLSGGFGGSVLGRGDSFAPDTDTPDLRVRGGEGGYGMNLGGGGGAVTGLFAIFRGGGGVDILSGRGGNSAAGAGGAGGNVAVRPSPDLNQLDGDLALEASGGGDGLTGGAGGGINDFINIPTQGFNPSTLRAVAGDGGAGVTGNGGAGGSIAGFQVSTANSLGGVAVLMAGRGGTSAGAIGGAGGGFSNMTVTSVAGAAVAVAGAGGDGFRAGGVGGSINTTSLNAGGLDNARVVAMAGKGGNAHAASAATVVAENNLPVYSEQFQRNVIAMGTVNGLGGAGGSINNFTQPAALKTSVDLVAGNGGSTINYGKVLSPTTGVGRGGSIVNVNIANDAGVIAPNAAIRAYAADFADDLRTGAIAAITNDTGNVGVVVGASGSVRNDLPTQLGVSGSVSNFRAQNIMSMVAGSVDRIAAITAVTGLQLQNGGTQIGVAKNSYLNPNDGSVDTFQPANPVSRPHITTGWGSPDPTGTYKLVQGSFANLRGGALIDGAIVTGSYAGPASDRVFAPVKT